MHTTRTTVGQQGLAAPRSAPAAGNASPELRRALANIRVIIAIMALLESLTLSLSARPALFLVALAYALYAGWLAWIGASGSPAVQSRATAWIDAGWILVSAWLAATPSSLFILLLLFPTLFASLSFGFFSGLHVSLFAATGASLVTYAVHGGAVSFENMLFPLSILIVGPLVAALARAGILRNKHLTISDTLLEQADPRLGVKRVATLVLRGLAHHFAADRGMMLVWLPGCEPRLFRTEHQGEIVELRGSVLEEILQHDPQLPRDVGCAQEVTRTGGKRIIEHYRGVDAALPRPSGAARSAILALAESLDAYGFLYVPICRRSPRPCWIILDSAHGGYRPRDLDVLFRGMEQLSPVIENANLLEQLSDEAVATERARIGRDLHDTAIQPYLGIKYAIEALARRAQPDNPLYDSVQSLQEMARSELHELREVVSTMRAGAARGESTLAPALRRQAKRFSELFGIDVTVECDDGIPINRQQSAVFFHLISEALTNIRRHTHATRAGIHVTVEPEAIMLRVTNDHGNAAQPASFVPRSITERAESLGGHARVDLTRPGFTDVVISIPRQTER